VASPLARSSKVLRADVVCRIREMLPEIEEGQFANKVRNQQ